MPSRSDDPELEARLRELGWRPGNPALPRLTRIAAYGVIRDGDRVLLTRVAPGHLGTGLWTLPGGGLEFGESPEQAVVREVEEETGLLARITGEPVIRSSTGTWPFSAGPVPYHALSLIYPMARTGGVERHEVGGSSDEAAWVPVSSLRDLPLSNVAAFALGDRRP